VFSIDEVQYLLCQFNLNNKYQTKTRKGLILYNFTNGINALKKHVYVNHYVIEKIYIEKVKNLSKKSFEKEPTKN